MKKWEKKTVTKTEIAPLCEKYDISQILASIFVRRKITEGKDLLYFLEDDLRFEHNPFCFSSMEDAVERILQAKEENEKILIFGDKDVDGVTSTAILYEYFEQNNYDVQYKIPLDDDPYGLTKKAIEEFANLGGTLIVTVDCGIANVEEISFAQTLGIDVIITDHHNPQNEIPEAIVILDPKIENENYPFPDISGAAVAYKLVSALRFSQSDFYNAEICFFDICEHLDNSEDKNSIYYTADCVKIRNCVKIRELHEKIIPGKTDFHNMKLPYFLQGQMIYVWNAKNMKEELSKIFGNNIEFNLFDFQSEVSKIIPQLKNVDSKKLCTLSSIAKYNENENNIINSLFNLYITYVNKRLLLKDKKLNIQKNYEIQLVSLAALADIMPMQNENRIFVKNGIKSFNQDSPRPGLKELFSKMKINCENLSSQDLSWYITPALNAAGRMGKADIAFKLLTSKNSNERETLAQQIIDLNELRKEQVSSSVFTLQEKIKQSLQENNEKLCLIVDDKINKGITGLLANKIMGDFNVPSIVITISDDLFIGSIRSCRGLIATDFLCSFGDIYENWGGHDCAAGFSLTKENYSIFLQKIKEKTNEINLCEKEETVFIDAQIPLDYLNAETFKILDIFEPFGNENNELIFKTEKIFLFDANLVGKKEPFHLKLNFDTGSFKIPAMFWGQGEKLNSSIKKGNYYDIVYTLSFNFFNGRKTPQMIIKDCVLHGE